MSELPIEVAIHPYPQSEAVFRRTRSTLRELVELVGRRYCVRLGLQVRSTWEYSESYARLLDSFLTRAKSKAEKLDVRPLLVLHWVFRSTNALARVEAFARDMPELPLVQEVLIPFCEEIEAVPLEDRVPPKVLFVALRDFPIMPDQGPWGAKVGDYSDTVVVVETTGCRNSVFHEFLHQLDVKDGYCSSTKQTRPGCERCWMQFNATLGEGLCELHVEQLRRFVAQNMP